MRNRPLVYVAGPYTHPDPVENTHDAIMAAERLLDSELVTPYVPHVSLLWHLVAPHPADFWYEYDYALLVRCDAVLRLPGESTGADAEVELALQCGIPVWTDEQLMLDDIETNDWSNL